MSDRLKDIPELTRDASNIGAVIAAVREAIQTFRGSRGNPLDQALTRRNAVAVGLLTADGTAAAGGGTSGPGGVGPQGPPGESGVVVPDLTAPPTATGFAVTAGMSYLYFECATPAYPQGHGHDRTVVYGAKWPTGGPVPTFGDAVELMHYQGTFGAYPSATGTRWKLWIKWRSNDGVLSTDPAGGTNGVEATTGLVTGAAMADATIDNAKIANLSAAKLTVGDGTVGGNLKSSNFNSGVAGWLVQPSGSAEFNEVVVRGTIYAAAGLIGGSTIGSNYMRSTNYVLNTTGWNLQSNGTGQIGGFAVLNDAIQSANYVAGTAGWKIKQDGTLEMNSGIFRGALVAGPITGSQFTTGAFAGYAWPAVGAGNFGTYLGPSGLRIGNFNNGKYFEVTAEGNLLAPGFSVTNGVLTINQANVISTLNLQGQAVTIPAFAFSAGEVGVGTNGWVTVQSVFLTSSGAPIMIICAADVYVINDNPDSFANEIVYARLLRNGSGLIQKLVSQVNLAPSEAGRRNFCFFYQDQPGAAGVTYTLQVYSAAPVPAYIANRSVFALETKR